MLKRILSTITITLYIAVTFTGCDDAVSQVSQQVSTIVNKDDSTEIVVADYSVAFLFSQSNRDDLTVLDTIDSLRDEYKFKTDIIVLDNDNNITSNVRKVVENNADLVIGYGQGMAIVFDLFQDTYPDTKFVVIDGVAQDDDIKSISFDTDAVSYALGVMIATAFNGNNNFGFIGDFENDNNLNYKVGYIKGLQSINKSSSIDIDYIDSFTDEQLAYDLTTYYQSIGVKFVFGATNPTVNQGIYRACLDLADEGKFIYTNSFFEDTTTEKNPYILSGITKDYSYATNLIVNDFVNGNFSSTNIEITAEHDALQLLDVTETSANYSNTDILNDNAIKAGRKALDDIKNKNIIL